MLEDKFVSLKEGDKFAKVQQVKCWCVRNGKGTRMYTKAEI